MAKFILTAERDDLSYDDIFRGLIDSISRQDISRWVDMTPGESGVIRTVEGAAIGHWEVTEGE